MRMQLEAVGIQVDGGVRVAAAPPDAAHLHDFRGLPLSEVLNRFMKWSQNGVGETLVKGGEEENVLMADLDRQAVLEVRKETPFLNDVRADLFPDIHS